MAIYRYTAYNSKGKLEKGIIDAPGQMQARNILKQRGLYVKTLSADQEKRDRELLPFLSKLIYRVPRRDVGLFARQLGTLLDAGLPLDRSLSSIIDQTENITLKKTIIEIKSSVVEGRTLSESIRKHTNIFPPVYSNLISVGEATGSYEQTLMRLADLEESNQQLKNKVTTAMFYPIIMLVFLGSIMIFLLAVVIPRIQMLFAQLGQELPFITRAVIFISTVLTTKLVIIPVALAFLIYFLFDRFRNTKEGRVKIEKFLLSIPVIGYLMRKIVLARFARNLGVMLKSGVSLIVSLQVVSKVVDHSVFEKEIEEAIEKIKQGSRITDSFRESILMTPMILGMISAGEASDRVPEMVEKVADVLEDDVDATVQKMSTLIEPILMLITGAVIIVIMVAILLPIYNLTREMRF